MATHCGLQMGVVVMSVQGVGVGVAVLLTSTII